MILKSLRIKAISWSAEFASVNGSYYDYVTSIYSPSEAKEQSIRNELTSTGWEEVTVANTSLLVFVKERHIVRVYRVWV